MLKKSLLFITLTAATGSVFAAPVANLKVNGTITPPTCTVNGDVQSTDVVYTFDVSPGLFPASGNLTLNPQSQNIQVVCDASTYLSFNATDERAGTELTAGDTHFGLGTYGTDNVGYYQVTMQNATVSADAQSTAKSVGVQVGSTYATTGKIDKSNPVSWATAQDNLAAGQIFAADFAVTPTLNSVLKNSDGSAALDGHAVLAFAFGV